MFRSTAIWPVRHPWLTGIGLALVPVVLTAVGIAVGQVISAGTNAATLLAAAVVTVSAALGLALMVRLRPRLADFGWRRPQGVKAVAWFVPAALIPVIVLLATGVSVHVSLVPALVWLSVVVGVNEEVWFRGLLLALFRPAGARRAVVATAVLFGVLHLANLAGGATAGYAVLQLAFAALFGFVAAELAVLTDSLWPTILWHALYDLTSYLGGDALDARALVGLAVQVVVLGGYAAWLWRKLPR